MTPSDTGPRVGLDNLPSLKNGGHSPGADMCVMEAVAYIAGEEWSDHPQCVCPVIAAFLRSWNDALPTDEDRDRLLKPLIPIVIDTRSTLVVQERRAWMVLDWSIRTSTPAWLDLAGLAAEASALRGLGEITSTETATAAHKALNQAKQKAAAAGAAAGDAAGDAAGAAAGAAAWDAARDAARDAAWAAAGAAAGAAARDAAWDALSPTTRTLQTSAQDLVRRMSLLTLDPDAPS